MCDKKAEIEKAFSLDERLGGRLDDSGEGTLERPPRRHPLPPPRIESYQVLLLFWYGMARIGLVRGLDMDFTFSTKLKDRDLAGPRSRLPELPVRLRPVRVWQRDIRAAAGQRVAGGGGERERGQLGLQVWTPTV